jgi:hypothetical protein
MLAATSLLAALPLTDVDDADLHGDAAADRFNDVGAGGAVRALPAGDGVVLVGVVAVVRGAQGHAGV